ncbi:hypothetical protein BP6252_10611 [Coleophoma cylindrospora]|uniref:Major facilitator superfamily (MFS) profile domain-containing protein n=1 Tax=Coleophoma cylindrospora TaxID=1849047 RepID=A0A3D8QTH3_9HELO|nr:hypothetical protein BP6252_10611 [Coleophoma cylindrospora]
MAAKEARGLGSDCEVNDESNTPPVELEDFIGEIDVSLPPDGGLTAWLQVASSWLIFFNVLGLLNTYGQFQTLYETEVLSQNNPSTIAWIGSVQYLISYVTCIFTGPIWDAGHVRFLLVTGTVIMVFGLMMLSLCHVYYQFFLAQAVATGIGFGFVFMPGTAILPQWFTTRGPFAIGVAATGSSLGAVIYPIMLQRLVPRIGFPWAVRAIAFMVLATMIMAASMMRLRIAKNTSKRSLIDLKHLGDLPYLLVCTGYFIGFSGLYVFYYYINLYAVDVAGTNSSLAFYLLAMLNSGSFFGRLLPNYVAGAVGVMNVQILAGVVSSVLAFALLAIKTTTGVIVFTIAYGFASGPFLSLCISVTTGVSADKSTWGTRLGMSYAFMGLGVLIGSPVAGAIIGEGQHKNWTGMILWSGILLMASSMVLIIARIAARGPVLWIRI